MIFEKAGKQNPFRVPEGYFENFTESLNARLPQAKAPKARVVSLRTRLWRYAAAVIVVMGMGTALYFSTPEPETWMADADEEYYNDELDYIMLDNMEIAEYLTEAE